MCHNEVRYIVQFKCKDYSFNKETDRKTDIVNNVIINILLLKTSMAVVAWSI